MTPEQRQILRSIVENDSTSLAHLVSALKQEFKPETITQGETPLGKIEAGTHTNEGGPTEPGFYKKYYSVVVDTGNQSVQVTGAVRFTGIESPFTRNDVATHWPNLDEFSGSDDAMNTIYDVENDLGMASEETVLRDSRKLLKPGEKLDASIEREEEMVTLYPVYEAKPSWKDVLAVNKKARTPMTPAQLKVRKKEYDQAPREIRGYFLRGTVSYNLSIRLHPA